jgi:SNF2 family DNA or RNA helicase
MPTRNDLHEYQNHCVEHIKKHPGSSLFVDMGLGKSISTLSALVDLFDEFEIAKVLIIGPLRVARDTWIAEVNKWEHTRNLKVSLVLGSEAERKKALLAKAQLYIINRENIPWLVGHYGSAFPFDTVVIDELSSFKDPSSNRFKALRRVRPLVNKIIGLTGSPASNGLINLWAQVYLLDQGERLGKTITGYRSQYFTTKGKGHIVYKYEPKPGAKEEIYSKISDICISMKAKDYLQLPKRIDQIIKIKLPDEIQEKYNQFEKTQVLALADQDEITAVNAAALNSKLLQFANGAVYYPDKTYEIIHNEKIQELQERIEALNGQPVMVPYWFKHDAERILKNLKIYKPEILQSADSMKRWSAGKIPVALVHPQSVGHGLNLQDGGHHLIFFTNTWSLELNDQIIARLDRQGQKFPVVSQKLICADTVDERVLLRLAENGNIQNALMEATKALIKKYKS